LAVAFFGERGKVKSLVFCNKITKALNKNVPTTQEYTLSEVGILGLALGAWQFFTNFPSK